VIVPDVNVLIHLHRDDHPAHQTARQWWQQVTSLGEPLTVPDVVWAGFVRVVTNRRVYSEPTSSADAWQFINGIRAEGIYIHYATHPRLLDVFGDQVRDASASGNLVTDAYIAAAAISMGATLVTFDRDFRRFDGLRVLELR
jgi:uncharacterized protein